MPTRKSTPKKHSSKSKTPRNTGVGAHGSRQSPAVDERPKWRGGGTKGENEQTAR